MTRPRILCWRARRFVAGAQPAWQRAPSHRREPAGFRRCYLFARLRVGTLAAAFFAGAFFVVVVLAAAFTVVVVVAAVTAGVTAEVVLT